MNRLKNINDFKKFKDNGIPISVVTCYDFALARIIEKTSIDCILVGDSLGMTFAGYSTTLPVTLEQMIYHTEIVRRGAPGSFLVMDLPFMSYHVSIEKTLENSCKAMKESGANAVKLEGGRDFRPVIESLVKASIPVMGHLGLTPQSIHKLGGNIVQGREDDKREILLEDAKILEESGVFSMVLELVPEPLAKEISESVSIPTIGIGAGRYCDGQVLVINDLLGIDKDFNPKFLKKFAQLHDVVFNAIESYSSEVKELKYPAEENVFK